MKPNLIDEKTQYAKYIAFFVLFSLALIGIRKAIEMGKPQDWDSLVYHLPIAKNFLANFNLYPSRENPFSFYPANIHALLSLFLLVPLASFSNLFNVVGLIALFFGAFYLAKSYVKDTEIAYLYSAVIISLTPVLRLIGTQMIDVWSLALFLPAMAFIFIKPTQKQAYIISLLLGLFGGAKYNHIIMLVILFAVFWKSLKYVWINMISIGIFLFTFSFWYVRNIFLTGNPLYPASIEILGLRGDASAVFSTPLRDLLDSSMMIQKLIDGLSSNYHIWLLILPFIIIKSFKNALTWKVILVGLSICLLYFITPAYLHNVFHDLRYMLPGISLLILIFFAEMKNNKNIIYFILIAQLIIAFSFFSYQPKAIIGGFILVGIMYFVSIDKVKSFKLFKI